MLLFLKASLGAAAVILISLLAQSRNYFIAGLVPLFPTFALIAHYMVGTERSLADLRTTLVFGMWSIGPYFAYLLSLYVFLGKFALRPALLLAVLVWIVTAALLVVTWTRVTS